MRIGQLVCQCIGHREAKGVNAKSANHNTGVDFKTSRRVFGI